MNKFLNSKYENLDSIAIDYYDSYVNADPFPHIVFDNFFNEDALNMILNEFPNELDKVGAKFDTNQEKKSFTNNPDKLSPQINEFFNFTNSHRFISFVNKLSGVERSLIPDPYLFGGGLHELKDGGFLNIHCDFNKHPKMNLDRRINALIYLNHNWKDEYGGALELWDKDMKKCWENMTEIPPAGKIAFGPEKVNDLVEFDAYPRKLAELCAPNGFIDQIHHETQDGVTIVARVSEEFEREYAKTYTQQNLKHPDWSPYSFIQPMPGMVVSKSRLVAEAYSDTCTCICGLVQKHRNIFFVTKMEILLMTALKI